MRKYKLTDETIEYDGVTLYRIEAIRDFSIVRVGDKGGFVQSELNLAQERNCWIYGNAMVYGVAHIYGDVMIADTAKVCGDVEIWGNAEIWGDAVVKSMRDYIVFKNWWSSGRYFTWTRSNNMWKVGCFYGTGEELITKAFLDSRESGIAYRQVVRYVESILKSK